MTGSPPQVRGKLSIYDVIETINRITPAGAGKTKAASKSFSPVEDHPRRCGENKGYTSAAAPDPGSPPQVRGKLGCQCVGVNLFGITPAGAGKTFIIFKGKRGFKDHPRRCGENSSKGC